jgi:hypothetical protein
MRLRILRWRNASRSASHTTSTFPNPFVATLGRANQSRLAEKEHCDASVLDFIR